MTQRIEIPVGEFLANPCTLWSKDWLLLTAGEYQSGEYNPMTVGWGSIGTMWGKPMAMVVVRPQRHTVKMLEKYDSFTLTAFPEEFRNALNFCGSRSGRDFENKALAAGLTPCPSAMVAAPAFEEAKLVLECKKTFFAKMSDGKIMDPEIMEKWYPANDLHWIYFGEILRIAGSDIYKA